MASASLPKWQYMEIMVHMFRLVGNSKLLAENKKVGVTYASLIQFLRFLKLGFEGAMVEMT